MAWTKLPWTVGNIMLQYCLINCQWQSKQTKTPVNNTFWRRRWTSRNRFKRMFVCVLPNCVTTVLNQLTPTVPFQSTGKQSTHLCIFLLPWLKLPHLSNRCRQDTEVWQDELQHSLTQPTGHSSVSPTPSNHHGDLDFVRGKPLSSPPLHWECPSYKRWGW